MTGSKHGIADRNTRDAEDNRDDEAGGEEGLLAAEVVAAAAADQRAKKEPSHGKGPEEFLLVFIVTHKVEPIPVESSRNVLPQVALVVMEKHLLTLK